MTNIDLQAWAQSRFDDTAMSILEKVQLASIIVGCIQTAAIQTIADDVKYIRSELEKDRE